MRLNARLDAEMSEKVEYLKEVTQESLTRIIKQALDLYYLEVSAGKERPIDRMRQNGFVSCGTGPEDLSKNYKLYLEEGLSEKYNHR